MLAAITAFYPGGAGFAQNGCACTNCPQFMPDYFEGNFYIQVQNAANPTLGQNGQGVCGVVLHFNHTFVGDLSVTLTSPAGQSVTLMGPTGFFSETDGTSWDITFVPCNQTAMPDAGFAETWSNDQNWGLFGTYTGTYYPYSGCLEDFNTGTVNGQWTLTVADELFNDTGNFFNYQILFCDPSNIECVTCAANAGNLVQPDTSFCAGDPALHLDLPPTYPGQLPPPAADYSYNYVVASGGIITNFIADPDLQSFPPGSYTVCGLSYLSAEEDSIPAPDGVLTLTQLTTELNSASPPFCGKITSNCVNINILSLPPNVYDTASICATACLEYHDSTFCSSGDYSVPLIQNDCPFTAFLHLTVLPNAVTEISETICSGTCASTPGFETRCSSGVYALHYPGANGCDSIVELNLTVLEPVAVVKSPDTLQCGQTVVQLNGSGSTPPGPGVSYHWSAANGGILIGPADQLNASAGAAGAYQLVVCSTANNTGCCDTAQVAVVASQNPPPAPNSIYGAAAPCLGQLLEYRIDAVPNASTYEWTIPPGASIAGGQGTAAVQLIWTTAGADSLCVLAQNACGQSDTTCLTTTVIAVPVMPVLSGNEFVCAADTAVYRLTPVDSVSQFAWSIAGGGVVGSTDSSEIRILWDAQSPVHQVCGSVFNPCGQSPAACLSPALLAPPNAVAGDDQQICGNLISLNAFPDPLADLGAWSGTGPGTVVFADSLDGKTAVTVGLPGIYTFIWTVGNAGCMRSDTAAIQFFEVPSAGSVELVCDSVHENFQIEFSIDGGAVPYSVNGIPLSGNSFSSVFYPNSSAYSFSIIDSKGCAAAVVSGDYNCGCISFSGLMDSQLIQACAGESITIQRLGGEIIDGNDTSLYVLHTYSGDSLGAVLGQNANGVFEFLPGMVYDSVYYVSFVVGNQLNGQLDLASSCLSVAPGQPVVFHQIPVANAGTDTVVCGNALVLSANPAPGQWTYTAVTLPGMLKFDDVGLPQTLVTASQPGDYVVRWTVTDQGCTGADEVIVRFQPTPKVSNLSVECDSLNENYRVRFEILDGTPPYEVNGEKLAGSFFESDPIPNGESFKFTGWDSHLCGIPEQSGMYTCACVTQVGAMGQQLITACETDSIIVAYDSAGEVLDANDVLVFVLHTSPGPGLGQILAQNKNGIFGFGAGLNYDSTYYVSAVAGNLKNGYPDPGDHCLSVSAGQPVRFLKSPAPIAIPAFEICGMTATIAVSGVAFPGKWIQQTGPGTAMILSPGDSVSTVTVPQPGVYLFHWSETNTQCTGVADVTGTFNDLPVVKNLKADCNGTNTAFTITFDLEGGTPPFKVDGLQGLLNGNTFISLALINNVSYQFKVVDSKGCSSDPESGSKYCQCATQAGTMVITPARFCFGQPAVAQWNNDGKTEPDDLLRFVLHDQPGDTLGVILGVNDQPFFNFLPGMKTGVTYYISAVAGNNSGGQVDWNDPCLSVSPGAPVQWKALPAASIAGDTVLCAGQSTEITFSGVGEFPLEVFFSEGSGSVQSIILPDFQTQILPVVPALTTAFKLDSVHDSGIPSCSQILDTAVWVKVNQAPEAGMASSILTLCANEPRLVELADQLMGSDPAGTWSVVSGAQPGQGAFDPLAGTFNTQQQPPGYFAFQYKVDGNPPCAADTVVVSVRIDPAPVADAGPDRLLDCLTPALLLGGPGTSIEPGVSYQWYLNGALITHDKQPELSADTAGYYTLTVSNTYGCLDTDQVIVSFAAPPISAERIRVEPVRCFGERNGSIVADSVTGGTPPYQYALLSSAFGSDSRFDHLAPGNYVLHIQDALGCEWSSDTLLVAEPPEIKIQFPAVIEAALGDSVYLTVESNLPANNLDTIIWMPLFDSSAAGQPYQRFLARNSSNILVVVLDTNGCGTRGEALLRINRERRVFIPNAFSPESAQNNLFFIQSGSDVEVIESFQIYDRWGECVFETREIAPNDPTSGWDGLIRNNKANPGVYVYHAVIVFKDGEKEHYTGTITLLR